MYRVFHTFQQDIMFYGVKRGRLIKKHKKDTLLSVNGLQNIIVDSNKSSFGTVACTIGRLEEVMEMMFIHVGVQTAHHYLFNQL